MARTPPPTVTLIGPAALREFRSAVEWLKRHCAVQAYEDCTVAEAALTKSQQPTQWMILLAAHRGQFENGNIERLHRAAPLARLLMLHGNWCEGETRSGQPLRGVMRVGCSQWEPRAAAELLGIGQAPYAGWSLPRTASAVDVALQTRRLTRPALNSHTPQLSVVTESRDRYLALQDAGSA
ncbi:MAG TPA: hypothetical protein VL096_05275, partial [Pirellulaceae bacterium]|nr:hypothetical protein [Pirellulaceae bacterium]